MRCPLITVDRTWGEEEKGKEGDRCLQEECAWWRDDIEMCAIKDLSLELMYTQLRVADIAQNMPPAGQSNR